MTRINCIPVQELTDKHLLAEYYELPRVFTLAKKAYDRDDIKNIPPTYTLGKGHVRFFYDKLEYLYSRFLDLSNELNERGVNLSYTKFIGAENKYFACDVSICNDWQPTEEAMEINRERIKERLGE